MHMTAKKVSDRGLLALVRHEGIVPGPYLDMKQVWTFGIGHTAAAGPPDPAAYARRASYQRRNGRWRYGAAGSGGEGLRWHVDERRVLRA